jgi:hypothetical protein
MRGMAPGKHGIRSKRVKISYRFINGLFIGRTDSASNHKTILIIEYMYVNILIRQDLKHSKK